MKINAPNLISRRVTFSPSLLVRLLCFAQLVAIGTMTSADFSVLLHVATEISLGKVNTLQSKPAESTLVLLL